MYTQRLQDNKQNRQIAFTVAQDTMQHILLLVGSLVVRKQYHNSLHAVVC